MRIFLAALAAAFATASTSLAQDAPVDTAPTPRVQMGTGPGTGERAALEDRTRAIMQRSMRTCWRMPTDLPNPQRLIVIVEFELTSDGHLDGRPRITTPAGGIAFDPEMGIAASRALRAVRDCAPYALHEDPVLADHYDVWRRQQLTFRVP